MSPPVLVAIDPAVDHRRSAFATFVDGELVAVDFGGSPAIPDEIAAEIPQLDARTRAVGAESALGLAGSVWRSIGRIEGQNPRVHVATYTPTQWKGSEPKPQNHAHLWEVLTDAERAVLGGAKTWDQIDAALERGALCRWSLRGAEYYPRKWGGHNLLDAAAIGATHLGRIRKVA